MSAGRRESMQAVRLDTEAVDARHQTLVAKRGLPFIAVAVNYPW